MGLLKNIVSKVIKNNKAYKKTMPLLTPSLKIAANKIADATIEDAPKNFAKGLAAAGGIAAIGGVTLAAGAASAVKASSKSNVSGIDIVEIAAGAKAAGSGIKASGALGKAIDFGMGIADINNPIGQAIGAKYGHLIGITPVNQAKESEPAERPDFLSNIWILGAALIALIVFFMNANKRRR